MAASVRNIVNGIFNSRIIVTNCGSFSAPSSNVRKTIFCWVGISLMTGIRPPAAASRTGLAAGAAGAAASGSMPHLR